MKVAWPAALAALLCTGCPVGADLDAPYNEYIVADNTSNVTSTGTPTSTTDGGTTGGTRGCANEAPEVVFYYCAASICHGDPGKTSPDLANGLDLFAPDVRTRLLDLPGHMHSSGYDCTGEKIVDTANPAESLLIKAVDHTAQAPCAIRMPTTLDPDPDQVQCITEWVNAVAAGH